ncbi:hypothetical protein KSP40_PGU003128 [Platanthera guangdongensis]|uniref:Uncharacterized protein n=1 Tax=Platanthera guangdongensis TaxID=2320717 RepID=A0ABR2N3H4_9ASPA
MDHRDAALYQKNRLRDEVLYLHGLWMQGHNPTFNHLAPKSSVKFKKDQNHRRRKKPPVVSEKEWPTKPAPDPTARAATGWSVPPPKRTPPPPSAENVSAAAAGQAQRNGVEACKRFFISCINFFDEEGDEIGDIEEDDDDEEEAEEGAFRFFMELLTNDTVLRKYYEENHEKGVFACLVCEGSGAKKGRTFGDCIGLVQHCRNVSKAGRRAAHRALTRALCRVLGWNFDRLPLFVLDLEETLGQRLAREASRLQEKAQEAEEPHNEAEETHNEAEETHIEAEELHNEAEETRNEVVQ